jgi:hypothetical protein
MRNSFLALESKGLGSAVNPLPYQKIVSRLGPKMGTGVRPVFAELATTADQTHSYF